jgi:DNA-binding SARP family transcriptional activator
VIVNELNRLTQKQVSDAVERIHVDLGHDEYTSTGIEAVHQLRLWQADYLRLAAELDAAVHSFRLVEQELKSRIDAALADWERRFAAARPPAEAAGSGNAGPPAPALAPAARGRLRGLLRLGHTRTPPGTAPPAAAPAPVRVPLAARPEDTRPEQGDQAPAAALAEESPVPPAGLSRADITALVLGPLELTVAGTPVPRWASLKARAILQYLLIHRDRPVRRDVLMALEWPDHSYTSARNNLNVALCSLRNTLDWKGLGAQAILHKEGCYLLNPELTCWIDRSEFLSRVREARHAREADNPHQAVKASRAAVQLYRGSLFEDDPGAEWYLPERRQLKELYLQSLEYVAAAHCDSGQLLAAIELGQRAISTDPCYEPGHRLLMRCYARQQQQQLVSRQYRLCAAALRDELDVSPAAETVQLFHVLTSASPA